MANPLSRLLLNEGRETETVVDAPAFSLTKVLVVAAPIVTAVTGLLADKVEWFKLEMQAVHFTVLVVAVLGLIAIAGSADLIARAIATAAVKPAERSTEATETAQSAAAPVSPLPAGPTSPTMLVRFATPFLAVRVTTAQDDFVRVAAATGEDPPRFLCLRKDGTLQWEKEQDLSFDDDSVISAMAGWNGRGR